MNDVEIKGLTVYYGNVCALENACLKIRHKAFLGIIGPNGGGKSTLLKAMLNLVKPISGEVVTRKGITLGYVPQFASFDKSFPISVREVVLMGRLDKMMHPFYHYGKKDILQATALLERLGLLEIQKRQIGDLSGGQLQKVLIARALLTNPDVLLLDEPSSSLDSAAKTEVFDFLKELNQEKTIVVVTHDMEHIFNYIDSLACVSRSIHYHDENKEIDIDNIDEIFGCPLNVLLQTGALNRRMIERSRKND